VRIAVFNEPIQEEASAAQLREHPPDDALDQSGGARKFHGHVVRGSVVVVGNLTIGAIASFVFWVVLARLEPRAIVGTAAALTTILMFLNYATSLGLPVVVPRYAGGPSAAARTIFCWAILSTALASLVGVGLFQLFAPESALRPLTRALGTAPGLILLAVLLVGFSLGVVVDARLLTLRMWGWLTVKTVFVAAARFPILLLRPTTSVGVFLFVAGMAPTAVSGYVGALGLARGGWGLASVVGTQLRAATRFARVNYVSLLALQAPTLALPLIVSENVNKTEYAAFFVAFSVTTVVFLVPTTIGQVLLAEGGTRGSDLKHQVRTARRLALGVAAGMVALSPAMAVVLRVAYGSRYQDAARLLLPLVAAVLMWAVAAVYLTEARITEHTGGTLLITLLFALATLVPAPVLAQDFGLGGVAATWIFGNIVVLVVALAVHHRLRSATVRALESPRSV
jgi:O-antigen/teichoic acid export membrane protein